MGNTQELSPSCFFSQANSFSTAAAMSPGRVAQSQHTHSLIHAGRRTIEQDCRGVASIQRLDLRLHSSNVQEWQKRLQALLEIQGSSEDLPIVSNTHVNATFPCTSFKFSDPSLPAPSPSPSPPPKITSPSPLAIHALLIPISLHGT